MTGQIWESIERVVLALWVGGHIAIGYIAAPVLFRALDSRQLAGQLAGEMFTVVYVLGLAGGVFLLARARRRQDPQRRPWRVWVLAVVVALSALSLFGLQPLMAELKAQGLAEGSAAAARFGMLHGVSALLYLITAVLGLTLVVRGVRAAP